MRDLWLGGDHNSIAFLLDHECCVYDFIVKTNRLEQQTVRTNYVNNITEIYEFLVRTFKSVLTGYINE